MESDTCIISLKTGEVNISIHALRVEGDATQAQYDALQRISIHALRVEGDDPVQKSPSSPFYFYPRPPGGGRPEQL